MTTAVVETTDLIDQLAGLAQAPAVQAIRHQRDKVLAATAGSYTHLFDPALPGLTLGERLRVALTVAQLSGSAVLAAHYAQELAKAGDAITHPVREAALQRFASLLTQKPVEGDRASIEALTAAGIAPADIIAVAQLIAFLSYQVRVVAGLQALAALGDDLLQTPPAAAPDEPFVHPHHLPKPGEVLNIQGFTSQTLDWKSWVPVVQLEEATPEQLRVLDASHPAAKTSDYYLALIHQPSILEQRSVVFNAIMYAPGGLSRAERELVTAVVSRVNGCVYCASVHAQRFEQLAKRNDVIAQVFEDPTTAGTTARERALVQVAIALTESPSTLDPAQLQALRTVGLSHLEILDALHAIAIFAWANRLMLNLGEAVFP